MKISDLLKVLVNASEKAANIARKCRSNKHLFSLLIEEKSGDEKNDRFFQDFKTLADVLIQETIRYDVGQLFPNIKDDIKGEETNKFENALGEKVTIEIGYEKEKTQETLCKILDNNAEAARELTNEIYKNVVTEDIPDFFDARIDCNVGIWIDPIDGTAEYINGIDKSSKMPNIMESGLECATVLIGVYDKATSLPIIGVVCVPFAKKDNEAYRSKIIYGVCLNKIKYSNVEPRESHSADRKVAITSSSEQLRENVSFDVVASAGAGYKSLKVIEGDADVYYLSKSTTFKWDTCACQAILRSLGGDILDMKNSIAEKRPIPLKCSADDDKCNRYGLIAYRDINDFHQLLNDFSDIY